mgnify:CR=1 FL=1
MRHTLVSALALSMTALSHAQYASQGIDLLSHIPLSGFTPTPGNGNSCWGYVSPSGREYALMGLANQIAFVEITNPATPVIRASIAHTNSLWADVKSHGAYAYVSNEAGGGIQIINMTNIDAGTVTLVGTITGSGATNHTLAVDNASGFLYAAGSNLNGGSLIAYNLANPAAPVEAGRWTSAQGGVYVHETQVMTYTTGPYAGKQIAFAFCGGNGLKIVDFTNKAAPVLMATNLYASLNYCHQGWLNGDKTLLYVDDEIDGPAEGVPYDLTRVFNVTNLSAPVQVGTFSAGVPGAIDHNLYVVGRYLYQSNYTSGLRILDLQVNPLSPPEVAFIDTYPDNNAATYDGSWNNWPFYPSGNIIISDIQGGLFVVRKNLDYLIINYAAAPSIVTPNVPTAVTVDIATTQTPLNPASVSLFSSIDNAPFTSTAMSAVDADTFTANLPAVPCLSTVRYYVSAQNTNAAAFTAPQGAPALFNSAFSQGGTTTLFAYDMETAAGWTGGVAGDTATLGMWERGDPELTTAQPGDDHTQAPGANCWITGRLAGTGIGAFDVDGGFTTLLSPVFSLAGENEARIGYWRWYSNDLGSAADSDTFRIGISNNGGTTWSVAETVGPTSPGLGWIYHEFRVADILPVTAQMRMRFIADDAGSGSVVEAAIDDMTVFTYICPPPGPVCDSIDFNNDGLFPDTADIDDFLSVFSGGPCSTAPTPGCNDIDFNNDTLFPDTSDIDSLLSVFSGGPCQ